MHAIGVAGTAKNTGKTTCLTAILAEMGVRKLRPAVTSIGYDGEEFDHLTSLPKPRIHLEAGALVATAEGTLKAAAARLETLGRTGVLTALGEVVCARVVEPGLIALAGPPTGAGLSTVLRKLGSFGADLCLVDGAFGRMFPMVGLDGLILATGAARHREVSLLVAETAALVWMFGLSVQPGPAGAVTVANLLSARAARELLATLPPATSLTIQGVVAMEALTLLVDWTGWSAAASCTFSDPIRLALAGPPVQTQALLERLSGRCHLGVGRRIPLLACSLNPFYPEQQAGGGYRAAFVEIERLCGDMSQSLPVLVVDVVAQGVQRLFESLVAYLNLQPNSEGI